MPLNVVVLANLKNNAPQEPGLPADAWAELDSEDTVEAVISSLESAGHRATFLEGDLSLVEKLPALRPDICFNLCEGHWGESRESHVPAILEMLRVPYTGAGVFGLAVTLDKPTTQRLLAYHGVAVPAFQIFRNAGDPLDPRLGYPLFVKPSREGSSIGISASSIVRDETELRRQLAAQLERYQQPILVERYVRGREVTVGVLGNPDDGLLVLPPLEVDLKSYPGGDCGIYTAQIKADPGDEYFYSCPAPLSPELDREVRALAVTVFRETGCRDVARIDFRLDESDGDRPYVIEVNALPGIAPGWSDLALAAEAAGMTHGELINKILQAACRRCGLDERKRDAVAQAPDDTRFEVVRTGQGNGALFSRTSFASGDVLTRFRAASISPQPHRYSIQLGACEHALVEPEFLRFTNHSCDPSVAFDTKDMVVRAVKGIEPGDEITYFYPSTEWFMAEPFECWCGADRCLGRISGASALPREVLAGYDIAEHIATLLHNTDR